MVGVVDKVLVKANDKVFAGEPLIHLADDELRARLAAAETQVAMRERARDERSATGSAKTRRKAEDAVADAERALYDARSAVDRAAAKLRASGGPDADLTAARLALTRAQNELSTRQERASHNRRRRRSLADRAGGPAQCRPVGIRRRAIRPR